jgi:hypothetical protein
MGLNSQINNQYFILPFLMGTVHRKVGVGGVGEPTLTVSGKVDGIFLVITGTNTGG